MQITLNIPDQLIQGHLPNSADWSALSSQSALRSVNHSWRRLSGNQSLRNLWYWCILAFKPQTGSRFGLCAIRG